MNDLVIFGSAEMADLAYFYFKHDSNYRIVAFTVDDSYVISDTFNSLPLIPFSEIASKFPPEKYLMHVALSYARLNQFRAEKFKQAKSEKYKLASYISSKSVIWQDSDIGENCFILENQTIQPSVQIGNNVMIWSGNHIGHATKIGDHTYISSHVVLSGHCTIGQRNFFGVNSSVRDFCNIGDDCFISMGASVGRNMPNGSVALSAQADIYEEDDRRAKALKRMYFNK